MSVPLDRLYNFLHDVCDRDDIIIYRFFPHGSRKIIDLTRLKTYKTTSEKIEKFVIFYDQEPLNFELYNNKDNVVELLENSIVYQEIKDLLTDELCEKFKYVASKLVGRLNLKLALTARLEEFPVILVHSEQRSHNLQRYQSHDFIDVYWWSHALIARDWFRYAELDSLLESRRPNKDFLVYNRAWSGTREYRLKFAELLINNQLTDQCLMGFNPVDQINYKDHRFANKNFQIICSNLENHFHLNTTPSTASADYVSADYQSTEIEIVLETLFDDDRIQLTEKILRPIACGQPFMLASSYGSLEYLRSYGFETFREFINEDYDNIVDPLDRLNAIVTEMKRIASLPATEKSELYQHLREISQRNKQLFFSKQWEQKIIQEYKTNFSIAYEQLTEKLEQRFKKFFSQS